MRLARRHAPRSAVLTVVLFAIGASATFASSGGVKITNCVKASTRPKMLTLTCGDGNTVLSGLHWASFGGTSAHASGTFEMNTCMPNCAQGKVVRYPVSVKAGDMRRCRAGLRVYNKLTLRFTGRSPSAVSRLKHWTLGCPT